MAVILIFIIGYLLITLEHTVKLNKSAAALLTGVLCWTAYIVSADPDAVGNELLHHLGDLSGILFFLLGAMTIVELIDAHDGFEVITSRITTLSKRRLVLIIGIVSFFLSSVLDNLTTAIVMMSLLRKLVNDPGDRMYYGGLVIIAANAGGAWSPIGDVTTTMLWVNGQISAWSIIRHLLLPSLVSLAVPMLWMAWKMKGNVERPALQEKARLLPTTTGERNIVFLTGMLVLLLVPVFKSVTHLPPFMGVLLGLAVLWTITEFIHKSKNDEEKSGLSVAGALQRVDTPSILFFLGILLAIGALESKHYLADLAGMMDKTIGNTNLITLSIGLASAVVDNVPLVAAAQGMYAIEHFPMDHYFWHFLAYCAGTGGSILIIGSAPGVAIMGLERIRFGWYVRKISFPALLGYFAGAAVYILLQAVS